MSLEGLLVVDKPVGPTSHDVVDEVRRLTGQRRVGHTGTLDPGASGILLLCLGRATRLARFLQDGTKTYTGTLVLGIATDTLDADGSEMSRSPCYASEEDVIRIMTTLVGTIRQVPPMVSAVKVNGRKLYELARRGEEIERGERVVDVDSFTLTGYVGGDFPRADFEVVCGKGTYVRVLAAEVGARLGCGAHVAGLRRTRNGSFGVEQAVGLDELRSAAAAGTLSRAIVPTDEIDLDLPQLHLDENALRKIGHGRSLSSEEHPELADIGCDGYFEVRDSGRLIAIYQVRCPADGPVTATAACVLVPAGGTVS